MVFSILLLDLFNIFLKSLLWPVGLRRTSIIYPLLQDQLTRKIYSIPGWEIFIWINIISSLVHHFGSKHLVSSLGFNIHGDDSGICQILPIFQTPLSLTLKQINRCRESRKTIWSLNTMKSLSFLVWHTDLAVKLFGNSAKFRPGLQDDYDNEYWTTKNLIDSDLQDYDIFVIDEETVKKK